MGILFLVIFGGIGAGFDRRHQKKVQEAVTQIERCSDEFAGAWNYPVAGRFAEVEKGLDEDSRDDEGNGVKAKIVVHFLFLRILCVWGAALL